MATGRIFDIKRYALHDGPGIRTTVFMKGCPLKCRWCHNPESISPEYQILISGDKCRNCGICVANCPAGALTLNGGIPLMSGTCSGCGTCTELCPQGALELAGADRDTQEVMSVVLRDRVFYDNSGGGMTISGGEPLLQPAFTLSLLKAAYDSGIHTALDTSGHAPWESIEDLLPYTDLFLYDIKSPDPVIHGEQTGADNTLILRNLRRLATLGKEIIIRVPLVHGINDREEDLIALGSLMTNLKLKRLALLPFHRLGYNKYLRLGMKPTMPEETPFTHDALLRIFHETDIEVTIGG